MGRQRGYKTNDVLRAAVDVFRAEGFHRASVEGLVSATGLNRFALYEKFGGKEGLFYATLDFYRDVIIKEELLGPLYLPEASLGSVLQMLTTMREINGNAILRSGCLIVNANTELGGTDERVAAAAAGVMATFRHALTSALTRADGQAELGARRPVAEAADYLVVMIQAFFALAYISREAADELMSMLIREVGTWRASAPSGARTRPAPRRAFQNTRTG